MYAIHSMQCRAFSVALCRLFAAASVFPVRFRRRNNSFCCHRSLFYYSCIALFMNVNEHVSAPTDWNQPVLAASCAHVHAEPTRNTHITACVCVCVRFYSFTNRGDDRTADQRLIISALCAPVNILIFNKQTTRMTCYRFLFSFNAFHPPSFGRALCALPRSLFIDCCVVLMRKSRP